MKPICVPCQRFYRPLKTGFYFTEGMPIGDCVMPGLAEPEKWKPYKLWSGDKWRCEGCYAEIIVGTGHMPIRIQHDDDFKDVQQKLKADQFQVNDC